MQKAIYKVVVNGRVLGYEVLSEHGWNYSLTSNSKVTEVNCYEYQKGVLPIECKRLLCSMKKDIHGYLIFEDDKIKQKYTDDSGEEKHSLLTVFFDRDAFYVDDSFHQDRTLSTLLNEYEDLELA